MNLQKMMKQAQEAQAKIEQMQAKLESMESEGSAGGGMVVVRLNGKGALKKVTLDPKIVDPSEREMLEDLIVAAFNDAKNKVEQTMNNQMAEIMGGLSLPPGMKPPF